MADIKDILGVSRGGDGAEAKEAKQKEKKPKEKMKRPEGMSREAFALLGGSHPIASTELLSSMTGVGAPKGPDKAKPKPSTKGIPCWQFKGFKNSARQDGLQLRRWAKGFKDVTGRIREEEETEYFYAKFNKKNTVYRYSRDEYDAVVAPEPSDWTREETDRLFELVERFDLRFSIVADRFESLFGVQRSVEDLRERYYGVARKVLSARGDSESNAAANALARAGFNKASELERKQAVLTVLNRTEMQMEEESAVLAEAKVVEERRKAEAAAQQAKAKREAAAAAAAAAAEKAAAQAAAAAEKAAAQAAAQAAAAAAAQAARSASEASSGAPLGGAGPSGMAGDSYMRPFAPPVDLGPIVVTLNDLRHPAAFPNDPGPGMPSLFDTNLRPSKPPAPGAFLRSLLTTGTAGLMTASTSSAKVFKNVEQTLQDVGFGPLKRPKIHTRAVSGAWLSLLSEVIALHESSRKGGDSKKASKRARGS